MFDAAQSNANHCAVIDIGVELIVELEVPAARLALLILYFPVADSSHLLLQNPVRAFDQARIVGRNASLSHCK
jgi:hypothetical protein